MAGILGIATSGLSAFQRAFEVTGNNIANINNGSYSRQTVIFSQMPSQRFAGSFIGSGVMVSDIQRHSDRFANQQVRDTLTTKTQYDIFYEQASQIDKLLSQDGTSISVSLQSFFNALSQVNDTPDSLSSRDVFLKQTQLLVDQFNTMQQRLDEYQSTNTAQIKEAVEQVNKLTRNIAEVNKQLAGSPDAPELLDQRDELLRQLSGYMEISVIPQGDNSISVSVANGQMLVVGTEQRDMAVNTTSTGQFGTQIVIGNGAGEIDITSYMNSGMLGGMLDFEDNVITPASQLLGQMAIGLATTFNTQHQLGMDMNDQIGKIFFTDYNQQALQLARAVPSSSNTGTGVFSVDISDIGQVQLSDYELRVTNAATNEVTVTRKSDGQSTVLTLTSAPPAPPAGAINLDGMTITVDDLGNLADDDQFMLSPTRGAAGQFQLAISDPREVAFASPVRTQASLSNTGTGSIVLGDIFNTTDVDKEYRIDFISPTQYNLVNVTDSVTTGPFVFTPNSDNTILIPDSVTPSYSVVVSGIPATGDQFTASYNSGGYADNGNGLKLNDIQQSKIFVGDTENLFDRYSGLISSVGGKTYQAKLRSEAADILHQQAVDFRSSKSGVNLDEEAANLLRFEQAYQAAGQLLSVANNMIDVLFAAMR
ncbi:flagellar hook-associated protein FlgK [Legionella spiritensis]|uniref:Flagellar hook-associated protein 1 n=1 Tax=Legionella spiritensis TaxID=452 RepID=A0A0W0Z3Z7_LEGSP|nr:flagellar hook-associated protein FlgK [Legionella spiritensis]KTD63872.1 flagellar hook-associated protein FlgK [Legionella spiritensis]SNV35592.1 flagellar hook-associated protein 1 FlgK [Legionella spiritensis]